MEVIPKEQGRHAVGERRKYVMAFNRTMIGIWKEQQALLKIGRTGHLYGCTLVLGSRFDADYTEIQLMQTFPSYGIFVDAGVGRDTPLGGRCEGTARRPKRWFSKKYYASVMNIRDFLADSIGRDFVGIVCTALDPSALRRSMLAVNNPVGEF